MAQSMNTKVDLVIKATSYQGLNSYGKIMVGDKAFEYYNDRNVNDFIQIPWEEVDYVVASVMFKGKKIPRYAIQKNRRKFCVQSTNMCRQIIWCVLLLFLMF